MEKYSSQKTEASRAPDALDSLTDNWSAVHQLFNEFDRIADDVDSSRKVELAKAICREIAAKTQNADEYR